MSIDKRIISHLETLARIELTPEEKKRLIVQLDRIVGYVKQLQQIDADALGPARATVESFPGRGALRRDEPEPCTDRDTILDQAPDDEANLFRVPRVIER
ncbi:MAG: Asp-tRNA(Asn)/Glu-tRNA(Gln) amidotransferase subunit GatC [Candidatus Latescibacterota bacterium]|nr:MAG: Asp-tRNA(Asn)/Glu-tRNA(Gln) amidotransferase subunit GatC [Candidatus Latescibacterota bacterium]